MFARVSCQVKICMCTAGSCNVGGFSEGSFCQKEVAGICVQPWHWPPRKELQCTGHSAARGRSRHVGPRRRSPGCHTACRSRSVWKLLLDVGVFGCAGRGGCGSHADGVGEVATRACARPGPICGRSPDRIPGREGCRAQGMSPCSTPATSRAFLKPCLHLLDP